MIPPEIVFATSVDRKAPTRFRTAAISTATLGLSAPVAMGVAIALAVSWKPFVKSKNSASTMTSTTIKVAVSTDSLSERVEDVGADVIGVANEEFTAN